MNVAAPRRKEDGVRTVLRRANLVSLAHVEIKRRITVGRLRAGEKIVLSDLAHEFGTSIMPVREALARLSAERLVVYEPNKGFQVAPALDNDEIAALFEARLVLELGSLELGLASRPDHLIDEMQSINAMIGNHSQGGTIESFIERNARFHELIVAMGRNEPVIRAYRGLGYKEHVPRLQYGRGVRDVGRIVREHEEIIAALRSRELERARAVLRAHIVGAYARLPASASDRPFRPLNT